MNGWVGEWMGWWLGEWMDGQVGEWMSEWIGGEMNGRMNGRVSELMVGWMHGWMSGGMNGWFNELINLRTNEWMNKWNEYIIGMDGREIKWQKYIYIGNHHLKILLSGYWNKKDNNYYYHLWSVRPTNQVCVTKILLFIYYASQLSFFIFRSFLWLCYGNLAIPRGYIIFWPTFDVIYW